jgi:hypothetical protein
MNPNESKENTPAPRPSVEEGLRALQKNISDTLDAWEERHDTEMQFYLADLKREARADAELRRWKSFARHAWRFACSDRDRAMSRIKSLNQDYGDLVIELQNHNDDDDDLPF